MTRATSTTKLKRAKTAGAGKTASRAKSVNRRAKLRQPGILDQLMALLPFTEAQLQRGFTFAIFAVLAACAWAAASFAGVPQAIHGQYVQLASAAGFQVKRVEVRGVNRMNELKVYEIVLAEKDRAMPLVNVQQIRSDLTRFGWIADARVSRQLPDTLVVDIVEREPFAVLQRGNSELLVDAEGHVLENIARGSHRKLIRLSGNGAEKQAEDLTRLLGEAPALRPQVVSAEWVGNRRWNVTFKTGQVLVLPEGKDRSGAAMVAFARMDGVNRLIGGRVTHFDLRARDRAFLRVPGYADRADNAGAKEE